MEIKGSVEFFCLVCGLQGMMLWDDRDLPGLMCPRCGSEVMTPHSVRDKASAQPVPS